MLQNSADPGMETVGGGRPSRECRPVRRPGMVRSDDSSLSFAQPKGGAGRMMDWEERSLRSTSEHDERLEQDAEQDAEQGQAGVEQKRRQRPQQSQQGMEQQQMHMERSEPHSRKRACKEPVRLSLGSGGPASGWKEELAPKVGSRVTLQAAPHTSSFAALQSPTSTRPSILLGHRQLTR